MPQQIVYLQDRPVVFNTVAPTPQVSTNATVVVTGSDIDVRPYTSLAYTVTVATNAIKWSVWGANAADFSDETAVQAAATVTAGGVASYSVAQAPFSYYRVKIIDDAGGVHGTATIRGIAK